MVTMNVSLPEEMKAYVDRRVEAEQYGSSSEFVRELIRRDQARESLREALLDGVRTPISVEVGPAYFDRLRQRIAAGE